MWSIAEGLFGRVTGMTSRATPSTPRAGTVAVSTPGDTELDLHLVTDRIIGEANCGNSLSRSKAQHFVGALAQYLAALRRIARRLPSKKTMLRSWAGFFLAMARTRSSSPT